MASQHAQSIQNNPSHLSQSQQDLLVAALTSQAGARHAHSASAQQSPSHPALHHHPADMNGTIHDSALYISPQQATFDDFNDSYSPDLDFADGDGFDFDNADLGGEMIGSLPGSSGDLHEKRKNSDELGEDDKGDAKRQETQEGEKVAKKPGRKPLMSEPTTKRKAQNRAAQRAFRERKEQHVKDLETKVTELSKAKEADRQENGVLKAQVERLQNELREYRKRLSLNAGSAVNRSPTLNGQASSRSNSNPSANGNGFNFDFPQFGALPTSQFFTNPTSSVPQRNSATPPGTNSPVGGNFNNPTQQVQPTSRQSSVGLISMSPASMNGNGTHSPAQNASLGQSFATYSTADNMHGFGSTLPQMNTAGDPFGDLFSPGLLQTARKNSNPSYFANSAVPNGNTGNMPTELNGGESTAGLNLNRVFQFNSNSNSNASDSASPSASSGSQWNGQANSSCGTSPEPSHGSPGQKNLDKMNTTRHTSPLANMDGGAMTLPSTDYSLPSVNTFDPVLFGDYRDSQDAIVGGGDFTGGFFDDSLHSFDYASPTNLFGILQTPKSSHDTLSVNGSATANAPTPSSNLMAEMDKARDGDYSDPSPPVKMENALMPQAKSDDGKYISCNNIWTQLQSNPDFQDGKFDLDSLCSELKTKARCSESGVMIEQQYVNAALRKLGSKDEKGNLFEPPKYLLVEQDSFEQALKRYGGGA